MYIPIFIKIHRIVIVFLLFGLMSSCLGQEEQKKLDSETGNQQQLLTNRETNLFLNWWIKSEKKEVHLNNKLRNKLLNKVDIRELNSYLKKKEMDKYLFGNLEDSLMLMKETEIDSSKIDVPVIWVNQNKLRACRKLSTDAMWDCLKQDYGIDNYYYISVPIFSKDKKYAFVSINYMDKNSTKSKGASRLFRRVLKYQWEEIALFTYWGNWE